MPTDLFFVKRLNAATSLEPLAGEGVFIMLCHEGECELTAHFVPLRVSARDCLVVAAPGRFAAMRCSATFEATVFFLAAEAHEAENAPSTALRHVDDEREWNLLTTLLDGAAQCATLFPLDAVAAASLFSAIVTTVDAIDRRHGLTHSPRDAYFDRFVTLLHRHVTTEHEVQFYASQVGITRKYLSEITKEKTGRRAKDLISALLMERLARDLAAGTLSLTELARRYRFADIASMGKFVKKITGHSPGHFRLS